MKIHYLRKTVFSLVLPLVFFTSCNGQVKTHLPKDSVAVAIGQPKIIKTQGSSEYQNIYCSLQDNAGNLWFGTFSEGVYRYDGKLFTQFTIHDGLSSNAVWSILQDKEGNIWFGTSNGPCRYDGKSITAVAISGDFLPENSSVGYYDKWSTPKTVWSMFQDKHGTIWFGTGDGVYCYDGRSFTRFLDNKNIERKDSLHLKMVDCILEDRKGNIWLCSGMMPGNEGIHRYDGKAITSFKPNGEGWVRKVIEGKDGNLYFATRGKGVLQYNGKIFINITEKAGIDNGSVTNVLEDNAGNLWFATELGSGQLGEDGGVWRFDGKSFTSFTTKDGLIHNGVFSILEDRSGNIWFGTRNIGLSRYDGKVFTSFSE